MSGYSRKNKGNIVIVLCGVIGGVLGVILTQMDLNAANSYWITVTFCILSIAIILYVSWVIIFSTQKTKRASRYQDKAAKEFIPDPDKGLVYIFRNQFIDRLKVFPIILSGQEIAWIKGRTFVVLQLSVGEYALTQNQQTPTIIQVEKGQLLFVEQEIGGGVLKSGYFYNVLKDVAKAKQMIRGCRLLVNQLS